MSVPEIPSILCVHCGLNSANTKDHWLPLSWYPAGSPPDVEKWSFPSCHKCNHELGKVEERLRSRLALGLDPSDEVAQGILPSVKRDDPKHGRNERDTALRQAKREKLMRELLRAAAVPSYSILPGLGPHHEAPSEDQVATLISAPDLEAFVTKQVRGLTYLQLGRRIEVSHEIKMRLLAPQDSWVFNDRLAKFGVDIDRRPAIYARVARTKEDSVSALYEFVIWGALSIHAYVRPVRVPE